MLHYRIDVHTFQNTIFYTNHMGVPSNTLEYCNDVKIEHVITLQQVVEIRPLIFVVPSLPKYKPPVFIFWVKKFTKSFFGIEFRLLTQEFYFPIYCILYLGIHSSSLRYHTTSNSMSHI